MSDAPFWVTFPTHAMPAVDWSDHSAAHRSVMSLFTEELPGDSGERRATAQILYRIDRHLDGSASVLVQTSQPIEVLPPSARATTIPPAGWEIDDGVQVLFRVAVTALRRRTERDDEGSRREALTTVQVEGVPAWLAGKLAPALRLDDVLNHTRETSRRRAARHHAPPRLVLDTVDGIATVSDAAALKQLRLHGVGRNKAYGAGLLTVRPLG